MRTINVSIPDEDYKKIKNYAKKFDMKISSILRKGAKKIIEHEKPN